MVEEKARRPWPRTLVVRGRIGYLRPMRLEEIIEVLEGRGYRVKLERVERPGEKAPGAAEADVVGRQGQSEN